MKTFRSWKVGVLVRELVDGVERTENIGKTQEQLGVSLKIVLKKRERPVPKPVQSIPTNEWPIWAKAISQFSTPNDKGIGDVVARMIGDEASAKFKAWHIATFGRPCNCANRKERWNRQYPL